MKLYGYIYLADTGTKEKQKVINHLLELWTKHDIKTVLL